MKIFTRHIIFSFVILFAILTKAEAQDLERTYSTFAERLKDNPLQISGLVGLYLNTYSTSSEVNRAAPFAGRALAAITFDLLGIRAPFTLAVSTGGKAFNYSLPAYSFVGISPSYKWVKMHLGDRSIDLGKYTFSRQSFQGIGTELNPGKFRFRAFYGRIRRARAEDFAGLQRIEPHFKRIGYGMQAGYEDGKDKVLVSVFQARDDIGSNNIPDSSFQFFAGENVIISTQISKQIGNNLSINIDLANSGYTEDQNSPVDLSVGLLRRFGGLLKTNVSTRWGNAFSTQLNLKTKFGKLNFEWERIDPGYKTMGSLFFQNDLQNFSFGASTRLLKKRMSINARAGIQQNNLSGNQANNYNRFIGFLRVGYQVSPKFNIDAGYSSFNNVNRRVVITDPLNPIPTTELALTNQDAQLSTNWIIQQSSNKVTSLQTTINYNIGSSILDDEIQVDGETRSINILGYYTQQYLLSKLNFGISLSHQQNEFGASELNTQSIGLSLGKQFLDDKLSIQLHTTAGVSSQAFENQQKIDARLITSNINGMWKLTEHSSINLNSMLIINNTNVSGANFSEWRNTIAYQYRF